MKTLHPWQINSEKFQATSFCWKLLHANFRVVLLLLCNYPKISQTVTTAIAFSFITWHKAWAPDRWKSRIYLLSRRWTLYFAELTRSGLCGHISVPLIMCMLFLSSYVPSPSFCFLSLKWESLLPVYRICCEIHRASYYTCLHGVWRGQQPSSIMLNREANQAKISLKGLGRKQECWSLFSNPKALFLLLTTETQWDR